MKTQIMDGAEYKICPERLKEFRDKALIIAMLCDDICYGVPGALEDLYMYANGEHVEGIVFHLGELYSRA